jgi:predicted Fe-Mo cluster-binding NifX family protein
MKIAIASVGKDINSEISPVAGRAPYILIFDDEGNLIEEIKNPFAIGGGGAGFGVAKMLSDKEVSIVVAGHFGENMKRALEERCIEYTEKQGIVKSILTDLLSKK